MKRILLMNLALLLVMGCASTTNTVTGNVVSDGVVSIPLADLSTTANFYELDDNGVKIRYFVVLGSDGEPRTAFDACDVCGGIKGYEQIGKDIKCRNCGRVFSIDSVGTENKGYGCWPSYLPHEIEGNNLIINVSDIKAGKFRFV